MAKKTEISFVHETAVAIPVKATALPIPKHTWEKLKKRIAECEKRDGGFDGAAWGLLGAGISGLLSLFALLGSVEYFRRVPEEQQPGGQLVSHESLNQSAFIWTCIVAVLALTFVIGGLLALRFATLDRRRKGESANSILSEMDAFEKTLFFREDDEKAAPAGTTSPPASVAVETTTVTVDP